MKTKLSQYLLTALLGGAFTTNLYAQSAAFTYQGRLDEGGSPADGLYDFQFAIYDLDVGGAPVASPVTNSATSVSNGLFTVTLDFGAGSFTGAARWLEMAVTTNGGGVFTTLTPRQAVTATPYAIKSASAATVESGTVSNPSFIGTTTTAPLDLYVYNQRGFQLQYPTSGLVPNLLGGSSSNSIGAGTEGAVVSGGGSASMPNTIGTDSDFSAIGGGRKNYVQAGAWQSTIGGGINNTVGSNASFATIAGGQMNNIGPSGVSTAIGGGQNNTIGTSSTAATIAGGYLNTISNNADYTVIAGGYQNVIGTGDSFSIIGGGNGNAIGGGSTWGLIAGGGLNRIESSTFAGTIGGGSQNQIGTGSLGSVVAGGTINVVSSNSPYGTILGGQYSVVGTESDYSIISGGYSNTISGFSDHSNIGGGQKNTIAATDSVIAGGALNDIGAASFLSSIGGGRDNNIGGGSPAATIAGGYENNILPNSGDATIAGGYGGSIGWNSPFTAIGGGYLNSIGGSATYAMIGGGRNNQILTNAQDATISGGSYNQIGAGSIRATIAGGSSGTIGSNSHSAVIGGGTLNHIGPASMSAAILGGQSNDVGSNAPYAIVLGGGNNLVADNADRALAAGYGAKANHRGSFVWADGQLGDFASTGQNQFNVRAGGGVRLVTSGAGMTVDGQNVFAGQNGNGLTNLNASQLVSGTVPQAALNNAWKIGGNSGTTAGSHFLGTADLQPLELKVNGQRALRLEANATSPNVIGGYSGNSVSNGFVGAVIGGGGSSAFPNRVGADYSTVIGGRGNTASGFYSTAMGDSTTASGTSSTAMGAATTASGGGSTAMGALTTASGGYSTAFGYGSSASGEGATAIGASTTASGLYSTAIGNRAKANHNGTFVWADSQAADFASSAVNQFLLRAGGGVGINTTNPGAMLQVGDVNTSGSQGMMRFASRSATGAASRYWDIGVPQGNDNTGGKFYSFVMDDPQLGAAPEVVVRWDTGNVGIGVTNPAAKLHVNGTAMVQGNNNWGVSGGEGDFRVGNDSFRFKIGVANDGGGAGDVWMRAHGGIERINIKAPGGTRILSNEAETSGVSLNAGGTSWAVISDRNVKRDFAPVDSLAILEKLATMPITQWHYNWESADTTPHIGPMAQDFKAAFYPGSDDKSITTQEADGVALAAIQGLNKKTEARDQRSEARIQKLESENAELRQELAVIKSLLNQLTTAKK